MFTVITRWVENGHADPALELSYGPPSSAVSANCESAALEPKLTVFGGDTTLVHSMSSFCDAGARDRIKALFAAHPLPAAARTLDQTLEQIDNCIALRDHQTAQVASWLATR